MAVMLGKSVSRAQEPKPKMHRIVFEVNVDGQDSWTSILNNVENLQQALGPDKSDIEVVCHGKGLSLILNTDLPLKDRLKRISDTGVIFAACQNTMKRKNIKFEELLPFSKTVPSGITEVVLKQEIGWSYVKAGF